jgi:hypothetical protein
LIPEYDFTFCLRLRLFLACSRCGNEIGLLFHLDLSYDSYVLIIVQKKNMLVRSKSCDCQSCGNHPGTSRDYSLEDVWLRFPCLSLTVISGDIDTIKVHYVLMETRLTIEILYDDPFPQMQLHLGKYYAF